MAKTLQYNAEVVSKELLGSHLVILKIKTDEPLFSFVPGQYTTVGLKQSAPRVSYAKPEKDPKNDPDVMIRKAYSIVSSPDEGVLELYLALVDDGALTPRLFALEAGDRLFVHCKAVGKFTLEEIDASKNILLLSTGTGLAPYMSMLRKGFDWSMDRKVVVMHGARFEADLSYREELEILAAQHKNFFYTPVLSRDNKGWNGLRGYIQNVLFSDGFQGRTKISLAPEENDVFLCGNPSMIQQATAGLEEKGFVLIKARTPGNIHVEEYW